MQWLCVSSLPGWRMRSNQKALRRSQPLISWKTSERSRTVTWDSASKRSLARDRMGRSSTTSPQRRVIAPLSKDEMFLVDSGAQFLDGTTDVTRTVHMGKPLSPPEGVLHSRSQRTHRSGLSHLPPQSERVPAGHIGPHVAVGRGTGLRARDGTRDRNVPERARGAQWHRLPAVPGRPGSGGRHVLVQ